MSFLQLQNIPIHEYTTIYLSTLLLMSFMPLLRVRLKFMVKVKNTETQEVKNNLPQFTKLVNGGSGITTHIGLTPTSTLYCLSKKLGLQGPLPDGSKDLLKK